MTKNEIIAGLLLEAAELLRDDPEQESLNEGIISAVASGLIGGILAPFIGIGVCISIYAIYAKFTNSRELKKYRNKTVTVKELSENAKLFRRSIIECSKKANYIKFQESAKNVLKTNSKIINDTYNKFYSLYKKLESIKNVEEFDSEKENIRKQYKKIYDNMNSLLDESNKRLKTDKWIENDFSIVNPLEKYLSDIDSTFLDIQSTIEFEEQLDCIPFLEKITDDEKWDYYSNEIMDITKGLSMDELYKNYRIYEPLKYIKIQFKK